MKKAYSFLQGFICAALIGTSVKVFANTGIIAALTSQIFYWNNDKIELEAYNINGCNYVRLRDTAEIFGVDVSYDYADNAVYLGEQPAGIHIADGCDYAKEDYSAYANQAIFDDTYTKAAYNAIRQSIVDREEIAAGNNADGYNENYSYAHFVDHTQTIQQSGQIYLAMNSILGTMNGYYVYLLGHEPNLKNLGKYPGYYICKPTIHAYHSEANRATDSFVTDLDGLSGRDKIIKIANYICDKLYYDINAPCPGFNKLFTSETPMGGRCGDYATAFVYLCQRADIPCLVVQDNDHAWNTVYIDGKWETVDACNYDTARSGTWLFAESYPKSDISPRKTQFAKELLVPGSTK